MFVKFVDQGTHAIVIELDDAVVQAGQHPGALGMEGNACSYNQNPFADGALRLE